MLGRPLTHVQRWKAKPEEPPKAQKAKMVSTTSRTSRVRMVWHLTGASSMGPPDEPVEEVLGIIVDLGDIADADPVPDPLPHPAPVPAPALPPHVAPAPAAGVATPVMFEGGWVTWYAEGAKGNFMAVCANPLHKRCRVWRRSTEHANAMAFPAQGRALCVMAAWICVGKAGGEGEGALTSMITSLRFSWFL